MSLPIQIPGSRGTSPVNMGKSYFNKKEENTRPAWVKNGLRGYERLGRLKGKEAADISFGTFLKEYEQWKISNALSKGQPINLPSKQLNGSLRKARRKSKKSWKTARKQRKHHK